MIEMRRAQRSFGDGLIAEEVDDLREDWMKYADWILDDETIVAAIYQALGKRHPKSRSRGRRGTPDCAEVEGGHGPSPHHCGLDGDRQAEGDRRGIACDRSAAEDGSQATLLFREE